MKTLRITALLFVLSLFSCGQDRADLTFETLQEKISRLMKENGVKTLEELNAKEIKDFLSMYLTFKQDDPTVDAEFKKDNDGLVFITIRNELSRANRNEVAHPDHKVCTETITEAIISCIKERLARGESGYLK